MIVDITYEKEFADLLNKMESRYTKEMMNVEGIGDNLDFHESSKNYFNSTETIDTTIDPNANVDDNTVLGYIVETRKPFLRLNSIYKMWKTLKRLFGSDKAADTIEAQISGSIYTHDLTGYGFRSYCWATSIMDIALNGLPFINRVNSKPAQHLTTFIQHVVQTIMFMSNQIDGAVAVPDLFVVMSYYILKDMKEKILPDKKDNPKAFWKIVEQQMQILIYTINQPVREGQSPYTNVTFYDRPFMEALFGDFKLPDGSKVDFDTVRELQEHFAEVMERELNIQILTFPVITAAITTETDENNNRKILDEDFIEWVAEKQLPHANFNMYIGKVTALSSCCRLRNDMTSTYMNSFGATDSMKIGSHRVCTINLPRIGLLSSSEEDMFEALDIELEHAYRVLKSHRYIIRDIINRNKLPLYTRGIMDLNRQYSTFGIIGLYEMIELLGIASHTEESENLMAKTLDHINKYIDSKNNISEDVTYIIEFKDNSKVKKVTDSKINILRKGKKTLSNISTLKYNDIYKGRRVKNVERNIEKVSYVYNMEQIPGESAAVKLLKKDRMIYKTNDLDKYQLYSNQFTPLHDPTPIGERMRIHGKFDSKTSGGAIFHINVSEKVKSKKVMVKIIKSAIKYGIIYFAINYNFQECSNHHFSVGNLSKCPVCSANIINEYSRVVGFITNKKNWSKERRTEKRRFIKADQEIIDNNQEVK